MAFKMKGWKSHSESPYKFLGGIGKKIGGAVTGALGGGRGLGLMGGIPGAVGGAFRKETRKEGPKTGKGKEGKHVKSKKFTYPTRPLKEGEGKPKTGTPPLPFGSGKLLKTFSKVAARRKAQSKAIEESLKKKGYKFKPSKTTNVSKDKYLKATEKFPKIKKKMPKNKQDRLLDPYGHLNKPGQPREYLKIDPKTGRAQHLISRVDPKTGARKKIYGDKPKGMPLEVAIGGALGAGAIMTKAHLDEKKRKKKKK